MEAAVKTHSPHTLKTQFDLQTRLYHNVLDDISDAEAGERFGEANPIIWIAGHLLSTRHSMSQVGGAPMEDPWRDLFGHGNGYRADANYPTLDAIRAKWNTLSDHISAGLAHLPEAALGSDAPAQVPGSDGTLGGMLAFLMHHEAYHLGQLSLLRRLHGKEAMRYG